MRAQPAAERMMIVVFEGDRLAAEQLVRAYARLVPERPRRQQPPASQAPEQQPVQAKEATR